MLAVIAAPIPKPVITPCVQISQDWGPKELSEDSFVSEELSPTPSPPPKEEGEEEQPPTPEPVKEAPPIEVIQEQPSIQETESPPKRKIKERIEEYMKTIKLKKIQRPPAEPKPVKVPTPAKSPPR